MSRLAKAINHISSQLIDPSFIQEHKATLNDFSRDRLFAFPILFMRFLRKKIKLLQVSLNGLFMSKHIEPLVRTNAYLHTRKKLKHTAFSALNDDIIDIFYAEGEHKKWRDYYCIAADGSKLILPNTFELREEFGSVTTVEGQFSQATFECYYDLLNHMALQCKLDRSSSSEANLALQMSDDTKEDDLLIYDRAYATYEFMATLTQQDKNYFIRCAHKSFNAKQLVATQPKIWSKIVVLKAPVAQRKNIRDKGLAPEITVRFISVLLPSKEIEIFITSLMDSEISRDEFKALYDMRWGGRETFYSRAKARLSLDNFTGKTVESVKQDFWSTIFISNFETIAKEEIGELNRIIPANHQKESFHMIKDQAFEIFYNTTNQAEAMQKMILLFKTKPAPKKVPRRDRIVYCGE